MNIIMIIMLNYFSQLIIFIRFAFFSISGHYPLLALE